MKDPKEPPASKASTETVAPKAKAASRGSSAPGPLSEPAKPAVSAPAKPPQASTPTAESPAETAEPTAKGPAIPASKPPPPPPKYWKPDGGKPDAPASTGPAPDARPGGGRALATGFAAMSLVPILLSVWLVRMTTPVGVDGGLTELGGLLILLMLLSAIGGFLFIRHQLRNSFLEILTAANDTARGALSSKLRDASREEIGRISQAIEGIINERETRGDEAMRTTERLRGGMTEVAQAIDAARSSRQLLEGLVRGTVGAVNAQTGYLMVVNEDSGDFVTVAATGVDADEVMSARIPLGEGVPGLAARERRPLLIADSEESGSAGLPRLPDCTISIPLLHGETLHGVLILQDRADGGGKFTQNDLVVASNLVKLCSASLRQHERMDQLESTLDEVLRSFASAVESRDPYARGHSSRVSHYCTEMARALQLDEDTIRTLRRAAMVHDLGKIHVPESLLRKEGRFSDEELEHVRTHVAAADKFLAGISELAPLAPIVHHHHERCDGSGYPDHVTGDSIPLPAHILIVANAFDVMTSDRSYRQAWSVKKALEELTAKAGELYDVRAVTALADLDEKVLKATGEIMGSDTENTPSATSISVRE